MPKTNLLLTRLRNSVHSDDGALAHTISDSLSSAISVYRAPFDARTILWSSRITHSITDTAYSSHTYTHTDRATDSYTRTVHTIMTACILKMAAWHVYEISGSSSNSQCLCISVVMAVCISLYNERYHNVHRLHDNWILWTSFQSRTRRAVINLCTVDGLTGFFFRSSNEILNKKSNYCMVFIGNKTKILIKKIKFESRFKLTNQPK